MTKHQRRWSRHHVSLLAVAALAFSGCAVTNGSAVPSSRGSVTPTQYVAPSSQCTPNSNFISQSMTGTITGCFRVPAHEGNSLVVSLQSYLDNTATPSNVTTTTRAASSPDSLTISLVNATTRPGQRVIVKGAYAAGSTVTRSSYANLCWDGCQSGLVEQAVPLHWTSPQTFTATLVVPATAWLEVHNAHVSVHPLVSGRYRVSIQCVQATSGCALRPGDASAGLDLKAPTPPRCTAGLSCASLRLSTHHAASGDQVMVSGWAPLQSIIGQPFGVNLSIAPSTSDHYAALSSSESSKGGGLNVVLAPTIFSVTPDRTWASLGHLPYVASTWAGPSAIAPVPGSSEVAWCASTGPTLVNGAVSTPVSTKGVASTLRGSGLSLLPGAAATPRCASILEDPLHRSSIFVGFDAAVGGSIPPVYLAGLYSTDAGATWQWVPTPSGLSKQDFSGFAAIGAQVVAIFFDANQGGGYGANWPLGSTHGVIDTEATVNGGVNWTASTLRCPSYGPCTEFGPFLMGNCAMNGSNQALMSGAPDRATGAFDRWQNSSWVSTVNNCYAQQLVTTSAHGLLLVDSSSQYELLQSTDSGRSWSNRGVPTPPGQTFPLSYGDLLTFTPTGDLLAVANSASRTRQTLFLLRPRSTTWCRVPHVLDGPQGTWSVDSIRVDASELLWIQTRTSISANPPSQLRALPLSEIKC
ncbi:MAG TPA: hypothetical protein VNF05_10370 [Acidimicrobiales bacterium]|nr:hypothetical protein [Acidimicrobiales bacterium]